MTHETSGRPPTAPTTPTTPGSTRRQFLRAAAVGVPVAATAGAVLAAGGSAAATQAPAGAQVLHDFRHRGRRVVVTGRGAVLDLAVDGRSIPGAVAVRSDGVLACPDFLPYSDADWGTDVRALARRLLDGNGTDYVLF